MRGTVKQKKSGAGRGGNREGSSLAAGKEHALRKRSLTGLDALDSLTDRYNAGDAQNRRPAGAVALFQQVKNFIIARIESGEWPPDTRIPSENDLIRTLSISRMTVHRALRELTVEGFLVRVQGVGTFVASQKTQSALFTIRPISEEIAQRGAVHSSEVHLLTRQAAPPEVAAALDLRTGAPVFRSVIVHKADGKPVQLADRYVNPTVAPDYLKQDFSRITPSHYLFRIGPLTKAEHIIEAVMPDERTRILLEIKASEPCLVLNRRTWIRERIATKARLIYPGSRFRLAGVFRPPSTLKPLVG